MSTLNFASPWMSLFILPIAFAAWRMLRRGKRSGIRFSALSRLPIKASAWRAYLAALSPILMIIALSLLTIALARPRTSLSRAARSMDAIAIAMAVDVSGSMNALDLTPKGERFSKETTRLAVVKKLFAEFVAKRPEDLISLVTFGGFATTRAPLTADHDALLNVLKGVEIPGSGTGRDGILLGDDEMLTAIGDGLATALSRLRESNVKSKIVILLSDGVSNMGAVTPEEAAEAARELGVKVYTIGVGTNAIDTPILYRNLRTGAEQVRYAATTFDEAQLKSIADTTGGVYFRVNDSDSLQNALADIDKMEKTKIDAEILQRWDEHFALPLVIGAILVFIAVSISMFAARRVA